MKLPHSFAADLAAAMKNVDPDHAGTFRSGVVLAGGGAFGAYQVGVLRALFEGDCPHCPELTPDIFTGASVGSINAAGMVAFAKDGWLEAVKRLDEIWTGRIADNRNQCGNGIFRIRGVPDLLDPNCLTQPAKLLGDGIADSTFFFRQAITSAARFLNADEPIPVRALETFDLSVLFDTERFGKLIEDVIPFSEISRSRIGLEVISTNFDKGISHAFDNDEVARLGSKAILASAAIPGVFPSIEIAGDMYVDGGTLNNTPILAAAYAAADLHVIYMDSNVSAIPMESFDSTLGIIDRFLAAMWDGSIRKEVERIRGFNRSLDLIAAASAGDVTSDNGASEKLKKTARLLGENPAIKRLKKRTVHRYHPAEELGSILSFLDLKQEYIRKLIDRGYEDTKAHDCNKAGCVIGD